MNSTQRVISVYFSETCSPLPIAIYPEIPESEILLPIKECIVNVLLSYDIKESEYDIYDKKSNANITNIKDLSKIAEITVKFKNRATLNKLTFIKDDLYSSQVLNQISNELKTKKSFQLDREGYKNSTNQKLSQEERKIEKAVEIPPPSKSGSKNFKSSNTEDIKSPPKDGKPSLMTFSNDGKPSVQGNHSKNDKPAIVHPFSISGSFQTKSEIKENSYHLTDKRGVGAFSFLPSESPFLQESPPPVYMRYEMVAKLKGVTKDEIFAGIEQLNSGELKCVDREVLDKQKGLVGEMIKKIMQSIAEGRGIVGVSLPVRIFEPRSLLERVADWWVFAPHFLNQAHTLDPVNRIKAVMGFALSGLYVSVSQIKPFNPILGETYQAAFPDGTMIYCEHTNHHPPISNFLMVGKHFRFYGRYEYVAKPNATFNELKMFQEGPNIVEFSKDEKIEFNLPGSKLSGLMTGDRLMKWNGNMKFVDRKNSLKGVLKIGSQKKGKLYTLKKDFVEKKIKNKKDQEKEDLKYLDLEKEIGTIEGSWLENLIIAGDEVWNMNKIKPTRQIPTDNPLPSDSRFREDLIYVKYNDLKLADKWKVKLEERQRFEKKLRIEAKKLADKKKK